MRNDLCDNEKRSTVFTEVVKQKLCQLEYIG